MLVRDEVAAAVHVLTEQELWVFNSIVVQGMSMRAVARQLSAPKTSIARIRDRALAKMRDELADNPNVIALLAEMRNA